MIITFSRQENYFVCAGFEKYARTSLAGGQPPAISGKADRGIGFPQILQRLVFAFHPEFCPVIVQRKFQYPNLCLPTLQNAKSVTCPSVKESHRDFKTRKCIQIGVFPLFSAIMVVITSWSEGVIRPVDPEKKYIYTNHNIIHQSPGKSNIAVQRPPVHRLPGNPGNFRLPVCHLQ